MAFADLKNDDIFRRIFATPPGILRRLLDDLLGRQGDQTIERIDYSRASSSPWWRARSSRSSLFAAKTATSAEEVIEDTSGRRS